ncbi:MAG: aminotransferase class I/II-fold pyridoxal phosphate-dependent enzyme [Sporolactobacillus sp.]|nr:aminotransferase class I/II-fold pyridoxal phosphate-dependent enzyme [Sporolactobacillus sp.]MCI1881869.1 aminotransferase class I/II-fold pyridoxal phosphate-dependent enzyme [Sporolactobacillus sp.]
MSRSLVARMKKELHLLKPSDILQFDHDVSSIPGMIKLTLGEPDFNTPEHIKRAGQASIAANRSHYAPSDGTPELRRAIARFLQVKYGLHYRPEDQIVVTEGATEAIYSTLGAILNPGDRVLIPTPIFPLYIPVTLLNGAEPVFLDTSANHFVLSPDVLAQALEKYGSSVKAIIFNFPTNPTGVTYRRDALKAIAKVLSGRDIFAVSDEIYSELTYGERHVSLAEYLPEQTVLINGASKSHAMTGWRIGFLCGPADVIAKIGMVHQFTITSAATMAQDAAREAFANGLNDGPKMCDEYRRRRDFVYRKLQQFGFDCPKPEGAFYLFPKIPAGLIQDSLPFCLDLARKAKVAVIPGDSFGPGSEGRIRISYAASMDELEEAMRRIGQYIQSEKRSAR